MNLIKGYVIKRLLQVIPALIGITLITFFMIRLAPGDPATAILGVEVTQEDIEYVNKIYGLDKPILSQYLIWLGRVCHFDFGKSIVYNNKIGDLLVSRIPITFQLALISMIISLSISIPVGVISAVKRNSFIDNFGRIFAFIGISIPGFWLGILLLYFFAVKIPIFPLFGFESLFNNFLSGLKHLFLPSITLGMALAAMVTRMTRSSMLDILHENYIVTARSKGLKEKTIVMKHAFHNAMIPIITVIGIQLGYILGGSVLIEVVFALPGIGRLMVDSIFQRDYPVVQFIVLFYAVIFMVINLIVDLLYAYFDPRITFE